MKTTLEQAKEYRDALSNVLEITLDELHSKKRQRILTVKRQLVSTFLDKRYGNKLTLKVIGQELMSYRTNGAHSMILHNRKAVQNGLDFGECIMKHWHQIATGFDEQYMMRSVHIAASVQEMPMITSEDRPAYVPDEKAKKIGEIYKAKLMRGMYIIWICTGLMAAHLLHFAVISLIS